MIDNDSLSAEDVDQIKEQLEYLLEQMVDGNYDEVRLTGPDLTTRCSVRESATCG